ncbi:MAG TPA: NAD(P)-dependent oxidoreductase [Pyrinomonadaceae bacterium]|jgi:nucleoside-diphosphate-sugar epimerase|nr:NAD(P)-dependent oxidoreductase [Pyrinomonadaceae bacterium]
MNIWITGSAGFLGQRLTQAFSSAGANVTGLSRRFTPIAATSLQLDLGKVDSVQTIRQASSSVGAPDVVIHAAAKQPGAGSLAEFVQANVHTTFNLLQGLKETPPKQVIYTSSISVYAPSVTLPAAENAPPVAPQPYAATKRWAEEVLQNWKESQVTVLRLPSMYGKGQADSFIDGLARLAIRGEPIELFSRGELLRDALHVTDVVAAIVSCVNQPTVNQYSLMNLGCGRPISTMEYAQALIEQFNSTSQLIKSERVAPQQNLWADISLARRTIGFKPTELRESLRTYGEELRA